MTLAEHLSEHKPAEAEKIYQEIKKQASDSQPALQAEADQRLEELKKRQ